MAINLETLSVALRLDSSDFRSGMAQAQSDLGGFKKSLGRIGSNLSNAGQGLVRGVTLPVVAAGAAFVNWAVDTEESLNKVGEIFEENAGQITDWSKTSATAFGLSQGEALEAAGTLGNLFKGVGLSNDLLPEFSTNIVQAAADLGSFNNVDPSQVLEDLQSGLVGETEPLRKYGILLNEAAVEAKAMELGLVGANGEITEAAKVQARYALILEQVGDAEGDFARTSGGLANRMRILRARFKDIGAEIGKDLIPAVEKIAGWFEKLLTAFGRLSPGMRRWVVIIALAAAALGPLLVAIGSVVSAIATLAVLFNPVTLAILAVIAAIALLAVAYRTNFLGFADGVNRAISLITLAFERARNAFEFFRSQGINPVSAALMSLSSFLATFRTGIEPLDALMQLFGRSVTRVGEQIQSMVDLVTALLEGDWRGAWEAARDIVVTSIEQWVDSALTLLGLIPGFDAVAAAVASMAGAVRDWISGTAIPWLQALWSDVQPFLDDLIGKIKEITGEIVGLATNIYTWIVNTAVPWLKRIWEDVKPALDDLGGKLTAVFDQIVGFGRDVGGHVANIVTAFTGLKTDAEAAWGAISGFLDTFWGKVEGIARDIAAKVQPIITAFKDIKDAIDSIPDLPEWMDPGNIDNPFAGGPPPAGGMFGDVEDIGAATDMAAPFYALRDFVLPKVLNEIEALVQTELRQMAQVVEDEFRSAGNLARYALLETKGNLYLVWQDIKADTTTLTTEIREAADTEFKAMKTAIAGEGGTIVQMKRNLLSWWQLIRADADTEVFDLKNTVENHFVQLRASVGTIAFGIRNAVVTEFIGMRNDVGSLMVETAGRVRGALSGLLYGEGSAGSMALGIGNAIGAGIYAGMQSWAGAIASQAAALVNNAILAARLAAQITSPSKKMMYLGEMMAEGLLIPLRDAEHRIDGFLSSVMGAGGAVGVPGLGAAGVGRYATNATFHNWGTITTGGPDAIDGWSLLRGWTYGEARA